MSHCRMFRTLGCVVLICWSVSSAGEEPVREFLQALRDKGLYEFADIYLEQAASNELVDAKFKERIPIERAENLIQSYSSTKNINLRLERMAKAEGILSDFVAQTKNSDLLNSANETLASLKFYKARCNLLLAESDRMTAAEKGEKQAAARKLFLESVELYDKVRQQMTEEVKRLTEMAKQNAKWAPELKRRRDAYTQVLLKSPLIKQFSAETFPAQDPSREKLLQAAISEYDQLAEDYASYGVSIDAVLNAARCFNLMGKPDEAAKKLDRIFKLENTMTLRPTRKAAALVGIESWSKMATYPHRQVIDSLESMVNTLSKSEQREEDWAKIQLELAKAFRARAEEFRQSKNGTPSDISRFNNQAAMLAKRAARSSGAVRELARKALEEWKIEIQTDAVENSEIVSFADAKERALDSAIELDARQSDLNAELQVLSKSPATDQAEKDARISGLRAELVSSAKEVLANIEQAFQLAGTDLTPQDQNHLRYLQAYAYYVQDRLYEPAIIGEFLLNHAPSIEWSRQAAGLAVRAYAKLYELAPSNQRSLELQKLTTLADRVIKIWPGSQEADNAATVMVRLAMNNKDEANVKKYSALISSGGGNRGAVGLKMSQSKWFEYRKLRKSLSENEQRERAAELRAQVETIVQEFQAGLSEVTRDKAGFDACYSSLLLVDALLELGLVEQAVRQLEDAEVAPLDLIKQKHPAVVESPNSRLFQQSAYRTAISVYLASMATGKNTQQWITKTQGVLNALRDLLGQEDAAEGARQMAAVYGVVANEMRDQFLRLNDDGTRQALAQNLAGFLEQLAINSDDTRTVIWAATILHDTANALSGSQSLGETARTLYEKSRKGFERALQSSLEGLEQKPEQIQAELWRRRALALAGEGQFEEAIKQFSELFEKGGGGLSAQIDAAKTLQQWGTSEKKSNAIAEAMMGARPQVDPKTKRKSNLIWGWRTIYTATRGKEQFNEQFHEATLGLVECQIEFGLLLNRKDAFDAAKQELSNARQRDATFGDGKFKSRYESLEKRLSELGK